jgi:hypothetical protein
MPGNDPTSLTEPLSNFFRIWPSRLMFACIVVRVGFLGELCFVIGKGVPLRFVRGARAQRRLGFCCIEGLGLRCCGTVGCLPFGGS